MSTFDSLVFTAMVFVAIVLLAAAMIVPTAGTAAQANRKMRSRIYRHLESQPDGAMSLVRDNYLNQLSPFEKAVENLPFLRPLSRVVEQSGLGYSVANLLGKCIFLGGISAVVVFFFTRSLALTLVAGVLFFFLPIMNAFRKRAARMNRFEEQLPEALDVMARALKAGHPFTETLNLVSEEMQNPIAEEFGRVFADMNFGLPLKTSLQALLVRMPSMSLHTLITAVLIQSETGGALAEILDNISAVIRSRFKLQRKVKTLSAEGRMSAWILAMIPFGLALMLMIISPDYLPTLLENELGRDLILTAFVGMILGVFWIRKIIRIEV